MKTFTELRSERVPTVNSTSTWLTSLFAHISPVNDRFRNTTIEATLMKDSHIVGVYIQVKNHNQIAFFLLAITVKRSQNVE